VLFLPVSVTPLLYYMFYGYTYIEVSKQTRYGVLHGNPVILNLPTLLLRKHLRADMGEAGWFSFDSMHKYRKQPPNLVCT
jgi:hypothetical protein